MSIRRRRQRNASGQLIFSDVGAFLRRFTSWGGLGDLADRGAKLIELAARLGVVPYVRFTGDYVSEQTYRDYLVGADLAVQLRTYTLGGLSGALIDCAAAGLPTVANQSLADAVGVPASYNRSINDALSPLLVAEALAELHEAGLDRRRPEEARRVFSEERSLANYSGRLCRVLGLDVPAACWQVPERKVV